jgi:DNA end-binding protein Ku
MLAMERASWKAFVKLSLVSIPVQAYTTAGGVERRISFHQLHQGHARIQYRKVCPIHGEVPNDEIVKGYEYAKGEYVIIDPDELERVQTSGGRAINIHAFVHAEDIDPLYYSGVGYILTPDGPAGEKPYGLLQEAMTREELHAVADVVLGGRQQLVLLRAADGVLTLSGIAYSAEVRKASDFSDRVPHERYSTQELNLTQALIEATTEDHFDLAQYHDEYEERLHALVDAKVAGREITVPQTEQPRAVVNLMDALRESLAQVKKPSAASAKKATRNPRAERQRAVAKRKTKPRSRSRAARR